MVRRGILYACSTPPAVCSCASTACPKHSSTEPGPRHRLAREDGSRPTMAQAVEAVAGGTTPIHSCAFLKARFRVCVEMCSLRETPSFNLSFGQLKRRQSDLPSRICTLNMRLLDRASPCWHCAKPYKAMATFTVSFEVRYPALLPACAGRSRKRGQVGGRFIPQRGSRAHTRAACTP